MWIRLVARIPYHLIGWYIIRGVECDGQLHGAQIRGEVAPGEANFVQNCLPHLVCELDELFVFELVKVRRLDDLREQLIVAFHWAAYVSLYVKTPYTVLDVPAREHGAFGNRHYIPPYKWAIIASARPDRIGPGPVHLRDRN